MGTALQALFYFLAQLQKCPSVFAHAAPEKVSRKQRGKKKKSNNNNYYKNTQIPPSWPGCPSPAPLLTTPTTKRNPTETNRHKQERALLPAVTQGVEDLATLWVVKALRRTSAGYLWRPEPKNTALFLAGVCERASVCVCVGGGTFQSNSTSRCCFPPPRLLLLSLLLWKYAAFVSHAVIYLVCPERGLPLGSGEIEQVHTKRGITKGF